MKNFSWYLKLSGLVLSGFLILGYQNCGSAERFSQGAVSDLGQSPASTGANGSAPTCSQTLINETENVFIGFVEDNSDSTAGPNGTDPNKVVRVKVLQNFLATYGGKTNFNYFFTWFAPSAYTWDIKSSIFDANPVQSSGTSTDLSNALTAFEPLGAQGGTNYGAAIAAAQNAVDSFASNHQGWKCVIVFSSDGMPTGLSGNQLTDVENMVTGLQANALAAGCPLSFSTVYFGPESDSNSIANLNGMATVGGGQFVDTNQVETLTISDVIQVPGQTCTQN